MITSDHGHNPKFHRFHTGLARSKSPFAMTQHFADLEDTPFLFLAPCAELTGVYPFAPLPAGFRRLL